MTSSFVYYEDGHYDDGDVGIQEFEDDSHGEKALAFIEQRRSNIPSAGISAYKLIIGKQQKLEAVQVVTKLRIAPK